MPQDNIGFDGKIKVTIAKLEIPRQWKLHEEIVRRIKKGLPFIELIRELNRICKTRVFEYNNITTTAGRTMIMNNLCNSSPTNTPLITVGAVGTDDTAVAEADTTLGTENTRKDIASITNSTTTGYITQFYTAAEAVAELKETGLFSDADDEVADDGVLVAHALIDVNKQNTETLTIDWTLTLSDA